MNTIETNAKVKIPDKEIEDIRMKQMEILKLKKYNSQNKQTNKNTSVNGLNS